MNNKLIQEISNLVENTCKKDTNFFGITAWTEHILEVVKYAKILAKQLKADEEVVELAALLHDFASVSNKDWYPEHHINGARLAREILESYQYPEEKIKMVEHAILTHRGSKTIKRETVEAEILASADSMAHFDNIPSLFRLAYKVKNMEVAEAKVFILGKLERSYAKLLPEAKLVVLPQYEAAKLLIHK
jgi:uncharacterized protein